MSTYGMLRTTAEKNLEELIIDFDIAVKSKGLVNMGWEIHKKVRLAVRIIGSCIVMLSIWGLWRGSFSIITFVLMVVVGIAAGYAFYRWAEHVREKYKDEPLTEKEKQKFLKWLSMGKREFAFIHGVALGVILTFAFVVFRIWKEWSNLPSREQILSLVVDIVIILVMFSIAGIINGLMMWKGIQNTAQKYSLLKNTTDDKK